MRIAYICGSPRKESESNSALILKDLEAFFTEQGVMQESVYIKIPRNLSEKTDPFWKEAEKVDIWLIAFPLYVDSLPGHMSWWLKRYEEHRNVSQRTGVKLPSPRVYGIANCGFPEAVQNREALKVLELFCRKNGLEWQFGVGIGMGEPYRQMRSMPLKAAAKKELLRAFRALADDLKNEGQGRAENLYAAVRFPHFLYRFLGGIGWRRRAGKYGLGSRDLYRRPLLKH